MKGYILTILGVVIVGILVDVIIPSGNINKFIKSVYSVFVVMVILNPIIKFFNNHRDFDFNYNDYTISQPLLDYLNRQKVEGYKKDIISTLAEAGLDNVDITFDYSLQNDKLILNSCMVNLKKLAISGNFQHNNKYEFIIKVVQTITNLSSEEIIFDEWKKQ